MWLSKKIKELIEDGKPAYSLYIQPVTSENYKPKIEGKSDLEKLGTLFLKALEYTGNFLVYKDNSLVPTYGASRVGLEHKTAILDITEQNNRMAILGGQSVCARESDGKVFSYNKNRII